MTTELATRPPPPAPAEPGRPRRRLDWFDAGVLLVFACVSMWIVAIDLWQVIEHHRIWTHTDGEFLVDQMQYLTWIRDAAHHGLVSDLFVIRATPHDYFQPAIILSGAVTRLGVAPWLALLLWKPVAVLATFVAIRAYCGRTLAERFDRRVALVLALFFGSFGVLGDEWIPFSSWGYPFGLIAIAALTGALVAYDRDRARDRVGWVAPVLGLIASVNHPWQGELLILIVVGAEAVTWRSDQALWPRLALPATTVIATALPLLYFEVLDRSDSVWRMAQAASRHHYPLSQIVVPLVPLLIAAAPAYFRRPRGFVSVAARMWPLAALAIYGLSSSGLSGTPLHAFNGITIPLAVLAVEGVQGLGFRRVPGWRLAAMALVTAATVPASVHMLRTAHVFNGPQVENANFISKGERRALDYLRTSSRAGGVVTRGYLGVIVPAETGRHTYVGSCLWSQPGCHARQGATWQLFKGNVSPSAARTFVRATHARFVLEDCRSPVDLGRRLGPLVVSVRRFGCAKVYEVA